MQAEIEEYKKQIDDAENSYEALYDQHELLEGQTKDYMDNKKFFDDFMVNMSEITEFYTYIDEECKVIPENEHVYRAFYHGMKQVVSSMKGL